MPVNKARENVGLKSCVPVSTTGYPSPEQESQLRPNRLQADYEARLITSLVEYYGWTLAGDGNLYNPYPMTSEEVGGVA